MRSAMTKRRAATQTRPRRSRRAPDFAAATAATVILCCSRVGPADVGVAAFVLPPAIASRSSMAWGGRRDRLFQRTHVCGDDPLRRQWSRNGHVGSRGRTRARSPLCRLRANEGEIQQEGEDEGLENTVGQDPSILDVPLELFNEDQVGALGPGSTRKELPVFMLDVAACPGGVVPLHIFEMRYRQMFNDIGTKDNRFGMLVSDPTTGRPCKYGAVLECAQRKLLPDGRQYVLNQAVEKFRVLKVLKSAPYTVMEVEVGISDDKPVEGEPAKYGAEEGTRIEDLEMQVYNVVNSVVELMNKLSPASDPNENRTLSEWFLRYSPKAESPRDSGAGESSADDILTKEDERRMNFSYAVAEMIAIPAHTKQVLLQSRSTAYRLLAEREILVKAQKELAARSSLKDTLG